jgi:hypothetical protein
MDKEELKVQEPKYPRLAKLAKRMKEMGEQSWPDKLLLGGKASLLEKIAYGDRLTKGKNQTLTLDPDLLELADLVPSTKGAQLATVGVRGIAKMGDAKVIERMEKLVENLRKTDPKDWRTQKEIIEGEPGFYPVPRGRDVVPGRLYPKFGYEMPELQVRPNEYGRLIGSKSVPLGELVDHPRLLRAYPELGALPITYNPNRKSGSATMYGTSIDLGPPRNFQNLHDTLRHELTHYTQMKEGWPGGTNVSAAIDRFVKIPPAETLPESAKYLGRQAGIAKLLRENSDPQVKGLLGWEAYRREAGEQLAEAMAESGKVGGGKIGENYSVPLGQMYDKVELDRAIQVENARKANADLRKELRLGLRFNDD